MKTVIIRPEHIWLVAEYPYVKNALNFTYVGFL